MKDEDSDEEKDEDDVSEIFSERSQKPDIAFLSNVLYSAAVAPRLNVFFWIATSTPESVGRTAGATIAFALTLWGIIHCARIMRRHTTSSLCISALMILLIGWLGSSVVSLATSALELPRIVSILWTPFLLLIDAAALILAIVGLAQFDRARFVQGRKQAIWTIVLSSISLLLAVGAFAVGVYQQAGGLLTSAKPQRKELPQYNCAVTAPAKWGSIDPKRMGAESAVAAFRKFAPEMYMVIIPEELGDAMDLQTYADAVKTNLASIAQVKEQNEETVKIGGLEFHRITTSAQLDKPRLDLYYEHWLAEKGGMYWQMSIWASVKQREAVIEEARKFAEGFEVLNPEKTTPTKGSLTDVNRPEWGFATHLTDGGWHPGGAEIERNSLVRFSAKRRYEALLVLPLRFEDTPPDLEALTRGMLSTMSFEFPLSDSSQTSTSTTANGEEMRITTERKADNNKDYSYILRVVRGEHWAWYVAGWAQKQNGDMEQLRRAVDAVELSPPTGSAPVFSEAEKKALRTILNQAGLGYFNRKEYDAAAQWFQRAYEQTRDDCTVLDNWAFALQNTGKAKEALALIEPELSRFPKVFDLQIRRSYLLAETGNPEEANRHFISLIDRGLKDEADLLPWINHLIGMERHDLAEAAAVAWNKKQPSLKTRRWEAEVIAEGGDEKRAVAQLEKLSAENPDDEPTAHTFGKLLNESGDYTRAGEVAERLLARSPQKADALMVLGWSQMGRKLYREAKATFERAAQARPKDENIQDAVRQASAALGQGNNSDVKTALEPVPLPPQVAQELEKAKLPEDIGQGHAAVILARSTGYFFEKDKRMRRTTRRKIKVLTTAGVDGFSSMEFPFDPLGERIFLNRLEVRDEADKVVATGSIDDVYVRDSDDGVASHRKILHVQVPGLRPGYVIDAEVTTEDRSVEETFPFARHLFAYGLPCASEAVFVSGEIAAVQNVTSKVGPIKTLKGDRMLAWIVQGQDVRKLEPFATALETSAPVLWLIGEKSSWSSVGQKYLDQIADRLKPDADAEKLVADVCEGLKTEKEKIAALAREVQKTIGYKAIEFGVRARRPNSPSDTLRQRFGDCKDHALLLHQLLRAAKIESHLALVQTDYRIQPELPSLDQFNHMVVNVPALGKDWLIDPTDKYLALANLPASLWDSHALVLDPSGPRLIAPPAKPRDGSATIESRRTISPDGSDWLVDETVTVSGYYGAWIRTSFANKTPAEQIQQAQTTLGQNGPVEINEFHFENLDELAQPARLTMSYRVKNAVKNTAGRASAILPSLWERDYLTIAYLQNRTTPFKIRYPFRMTSDVTVKLPENATIASLAKRGKSPFAEWELAVNKVSPKGDAWKINGQFRAQTGEWPAKEYAAWCDGWDSARRAWETGIEWRVR